MIKKPKQIELRKKKEKNIFVFHRKIRHSKGNSILLNGYNSGTITFPKLTILVTYLIIKNESLTKMLNFTTQLLLRNTLFLIRKLVDDAKRESEDHCQWSSTNHQLKLRGHSITT